MSRLVRGTTVLLVGVLLVRLTVTETYQRYVRVGLGPWLLVAGVLLALLGLVGVVRAVRAPEHDAHDDHEHTHPGGDRVGWLLLAPVLALLLVTPPALGSAAVDRSTVTVSGSAPVFAPLPTAAEPRRMTVQEFQDRALDRSGSSLHGHVVSVTGFVARPRDGDGFRLARYQIACCAADAVAAVVRVTGPAVQGAGTLRLEQWFTVTGTFGAVGADGVPELAAATLTPIQPPVDPYE